MHKFIKTHRLFQCKSFYLKINDRGGIIIASSRNKSSDYYVSMLEKEDFPIKFWDYLLLTSFF